MITFWDIDSTLPGKVWSPNTLKTRIALSYKGLPFRTEWIEYPDIEPLCKKIGAPPTGKKNDGGDLYTAPFIYDESTGRAVSESAVIAKYLDETYPDTPAVFPKITISGEPLSSTAAIALFEEFFMKNVFESMIPFMLAYNTTVFNPRSEAHYRPAREITFKSKLEDLSPAGSEKRVQDWQNVKEGLNKVNTIFFQNDGEKKQGGKVGFFLGEVFSYADIVLASILLWMKVEVDPEEWKAVASWNDGRWEQLLESTKQHYQLGV